MEVIEAKSTLPSRVSPLLAGARARAGMQALADRLAEAGTPARVFGHPAMLPGNGNVLLAAGSAGLAALVGLVAPEVGRLASLGAVAFVGLLGLGVDLWPRTAAWTVIVGQPGRDTRRLSVLALDNRVPRRWLFGVAAAAAAVNTAAPGAALGLVVAVVACAACIVERGRPRALPLETALAWVARRAGVPGTVVLVSTAASGYGEGVDCVVDWFELDRRALQVEVDEEQPSGVVERLRAAGIGAPLAAEAADVVAVDRARG
jgi:hypothetical protein